MNIYVDKCNIVLYIIVERRSMKINIVSIIGEKESSSYGVSVIEVSKEYMLESRALFMVYINRYFIYIDILFFHVVNKSRKRKVVYD